MSKQRGGVLVDMGNVIIDHTNTTPQLVLQGDYNGIPEVVGAFDGLRALNEKFGGNVTVVYKATDIADEKILNWLIHHDFTKRTGILLERVLRTQNGRDKTAHMRQSSSTHMGTTVVIDDRSEVMTYFVDKVPTLILFNPRSQEMGTYKKTGVLGRCCIVRSWQQVHKVLGL